MRVGCIIHWWDEDVGDHGVGEWWWFRTGTKHHELNPMCHISHMVWRKLNGANLLGVSSIEPITKQIES
jgi:hypothetical protein